VRSVKTREQRRNPVAPFITSTLQQESARKLRFSVKRTMMLAQRLYEGIELGKEGAVGLITYMRTDSARARAVAEARRDRRIRSVPAKRQRLQVQEAQDAHEAIRPTSVCTSGRPSTSPKTMKLTGSPGLRSGFTDDAAVADHHRGLSETGAAATITLPRTGMCRRGLLAFTGRTEGRRGRGAGTSSPPSRRRGLNSRPIRQPSPTHARHRRSVKN
jgi:hypothetical protein